ncbi:ABC transporter substrate-binding protein [Neobacillus jeddahensis]|uniref:ABC transporter substrate-binding protein n=1 Tax=Neobacillus jeddahensis TaxID=1461580 RepID=UPI00058C57DF|nr:ABC transporter substrate-binding protein [Neobacillus jeddahensis]
MKVNAEDYIRLYQAFEDVEMGMPREATMEQIAAILFCTPRNAKYILTRLADVKWLIFSSGKGRGHKSSITFLMLPEQVILKEADQLMATGGISTILDLISMYKGDLDGKKIISDWLNRYFGYQRGIIDSLRFPLFRPINTLDPVNVFYDFDAHMIEQIYSTLLTIDLDTSEIKPHLAHHWESNQTATKWRFYLRKGILFHHGRELEAKDVVYSFKRLKECEEQHSQQWLMENVDQVIVIDKYIVEVHLSKPNTLFAQFVSFTPASIVPYDVETEPFSGTGPFKVAKKTESICVLEAFPSYFQGRAHLDKIEIIILPSNMQAWNEGMTGWDKIFVSTGERKTPREGVGWDKIDYFYHGSSMLTVNLLDQNRPQSDPLFRKALSLLINRQKLIEELGEYRIYPSDGFMYRKKDLGSRNNQDTLLEAKALLSQCAYNGERLALFTYERHAPDAYWLKKELEQFGIYLDVTIVSWQDMLLESNQRQADFILFEATASQNEMSQLELVKYPSSFIRAHLNEEEKIRLDQTIDQILQLHSPTERAAAFLQIEEGFKANDSLIFLVHKTISSSFHTSVKGIHFNLRSGVVFKDIWLQSDSLLEL